MFARTSNGPPGPTVSGKRTTETRTTGFTSAYAVRFVQVWVYAAGPEVLCVSSLTKLDAFGAYHRSVAAPPADAEWTRTVSKVVLATDTLSVPFAQLWASTGASPLRGCTRSMSCPMGMLMWRWTAPVVFRVDVTFHASPILSGKSKSSSGGRLRAVRFPAAVSGRVPKSGRTAVPEPENVSFTFTVARSPRSFHVYPRTFEEVNE